MRYLLTLFIFSPSLLLAQSSIKGVIVNEKKEPLPLTNIVVLNSYAGTITNESGEFILSNTTPTDSLKISNIAYYSKVIAIKDFEFGDTITLSENIKQLNGVVLRNLSNYTNEATLGFYDYSNNGSFQLMPGNQIAIYIANKKDKEAWIKGVSFKVKDLGKCKNNMRIRVLKMDNVKFMPSFDILDENVIIKSNDLKKANYIDLSAYKIFLPKEGVFVVLEWLYPDHDCDKKSYTAISSNLTVPDNIIWFNFRDKAWSKDFRPRLPNGNYNTPNIGLKVTY